MIIHTEEREGFTLEFSTEPEQDDPAGHFASGNDAADAEIVAKIHAGDYAWFVAKVAAVREGIELGVDYLGGCCYDNEESFVKESGGYFDDMCSSAIGDARATLARLCGCDEGSA